MRFAGILCLLLVISMIFVPVISIGSNEKSVFSSFTEKSDKVSDKKEKNSTIDVLISKSGKTETVDLFDYTVGAVCAEISPSYEMEAIKAQAVACRTYALYMKKNSSSDSNLNGADISDDYTKHQGYLSKEALKEKWGDKFDTYYSKIESAVKEVSDKAITYDGKLIQPAFFALCAGYTENASDIWGGSAPYLKSVVSSGDNLSPDLSSSQTFSESEFKECASSLSGCDLSGEAGTWISDIQKTEAGAVKSVNIGEKEFTGTQLQSAFSLRSNNFTVSYSDSAFTFTVLGNGHGVGMSQYGADYMARQGSSYTEILKHYYSGVKIESYEV